MSELVLFHEIADPGSAKIRKLILDRHLGAKFKFRNTHYEEAAADFKAFGGTQPPAIWDGQALHVGEDACTRFIASMASSG